MLVRLFVFFGGLIVLALCAALIGPYFIDWTPYRADFEREAGRILGRQVTVRGSATARLIPFPSVTFSDIEVAGNDGGEPVMTAEGFSMDAELAPFLRGEILIFDMRVVRPKLRLGVSREGTLDLAIRPDVPVSPGQIRLENVAIENGEILLAHHGSGREHSIAKINSRISARSLAGPWRLQGELEADGIPLDFEVSTGALEDDGAMRLRTRLYPRHVGVAVESDGPARLDNGSLYYEGRFSIVDTGEGGAAPMTDTGMAGAPVTDKTGQNGNVFRVSGRFHLDHKFLGVDEFRFETGSRTDPYVAEGTAFVDLGSDPRFALQASGQQWQVDGADTAGEATVTLRQRFDAFMALVSGMPEPVIPGTIDINLPAIVAGQTTFRDLRLQARPEGRIWQISKMTAKLPGRATLEASGMLETGTAPRFDGSLLLAVQQPSGFAAWLASDVDEAIRRLPAAGFSADAELSEERQVFRNLELVLGEAHFRGEAERNNPADGTPAARIDLEGEALDLRDARALASVFATADGPRHGDHDIELNLRAGPVQLGRLQAASVDTALRLKDGVVEIDKLAIADLEGAQISATGRADGFGSDFAGRTDLAIVAADLAPLVKGLQDQFPGHWLAKAVSRRVGAYPALFSDSRIELVASVAAPAPGVPSNAAISASGVAGGTDFSLSASGPVDTLSHGTGEISFSFNGINERGEALLALYGLPVLPLELIGPLETAIRAEGSIDEAIETAITLSGADFKADISGNASLDIAGEFSASGKMSISGSDVETYLAAVTLGYPGMGSGLPVDLTAEFDLADGRLDIADLKGVIADSAISGNLIARIEEQLPKLEGSVSLENLDLLPLAITVLGSDAFDSAGGEWPGQPFSAQASVPVALALNVEAQQVSAGLPRQLAGAAMTLRLDADGLAVSDFKADYGGGKVTGGLDLKNNGGTALLSMHTNVTGARDLAGIRSASAVAGLSATLSGSGKTVETLVAALSGSGTVTAKDLNVEGFDPSVFSQILELADEVDPSAIETLDVDKVAGPVISQGRTEIEALEFPFLVAGGTVRSAPVTVSAKGAAITGELELDLPSRQASIEGRIVFDAGREALVGSEPVIGFAITGRPASLSVTYDMAGLKQYLTQRAFEKEQARVERMQAILLERQRLRRFVRLFRYEEDLREAERQRLAEEARRQEEARRAAEEAARREAEARRAEEEARRAEEEARRAVQEEARRLREAEEARRLAEEARRQEEQLRAQKERARREEEALRARIAEDAARAAAEARRAEEEARRREEALRAESELARRLERERAAEEARRNAELEAERRAAAEARRKRELQTLPGVELPQISRPLGEEGGPSGDSGIFDDRKLSLDEFLKRLQEIE